MNKSKEQHQRLFGDWTPEDGGSKTDAFFNKLFKDIKEGTFPRSDYQPMDSRPESDSKLNQQAV